MRFMAARAENGEKDINFICTINVCYFYLKDYFHTKRNTMQWNVYYNKKKEIPSQPPPETSTISTIFNLSFNNVLFFLFIVMIIPTTKQIKLFHY